MLLPNEGAYVNFLLNSQKVPLVEMTPPDIKTIENVIPTVRELATSDKYEFVQTKNISNIHLNILEEYMIDLNKHLFLMFKLIINMNVHYFYV